MKVGFFLTARLGSSRLPRKHLLEANGVALLEVLIRRISTAFADDIESGVAEIVIVTSDEAENREFERFSNFGVKTFYGSKQNIPRRHLEAAQALGVDIIVAVDGDDILCSTVAMRSVRDGLVNGEDYTKSSGLPLGVNAFGYRRGFLTAAVDGNEDKVLETGWGYIFDASRLIEHAMQLSCPTLDNLRFTLDYPEDFEFFLRIIEHFGNRIFTVPDEEIVSYVMDSKLFEITDPIAERYWDNFRDVQQAEMSRDTSAGNQHALGR